MAVKNSFEAAVFQVMLWGLVLFLTLSGGAAYLRNYSQGRDYRLWLDSIPFKIVYETYRRTGGTLNWELFMVDANGFNTVNLTKTSNIDEMYPHVSPDGSKICFVADEVIDRKKVRSVYFMNINDGKRFLVAHNARQPCWSPDGKRIAYLKGEYERYTVQPYATSKLFIYDLKTGEHKEHPNRQLQHIYAICWSPGGRWFLGAVQGAMGFSDAIIAFEADGKRVFDLGKWGVKGCRPDIRYDGSKLLWGETDWGLCLADLSFTSDGPRVSNIRRILKCDRRSKIYHFDFSPDGRKVVFSYGPFRGAQNVGGIARGWNLCVSDLQGNWVQITYDGLSNKEPDWVPIYERRR